MSRTPAAPLPLHSAQPVWQRFLYCSLVVALLPLAVYTFMGDDTEQRIASTFEHNPDLHVAMERLSESADDHDFFNLLPDHRFEGAAFARESKLHWGMAVVSAGVFFGVTLLLFPGFKRSPLKLIGVGLFTGTIGIVMLLAVQWAAEFTQGRALIGRNVLVLLFWIVKFIGYSYSCGLDPESDFVVSFFGYTFGVGLCEELCKVLPVLFILRASSDDHAMSWQKACTWGLISGVGFGVSEGILYSGDYYNGITTGGVYWVRFVSCVALHAIWAASAAIFLHRHRRQMNDSDSFWGMLFTVMVLLIIPMMLHGLYDTLLKKQYVVLALVSAVASFGWFAYLVETSRQRFGDRDLATA